MCTFQRRQANLFGKAVLYLEPFIDQIRQVWGLRVPCPTWIKIIFTIMVSVMIVFPLVYPPLLAYGTLAVAQAIIEK